MWPLDFISEADFKAHVENTIKEYKDALQAYDLEKFNRNIIDPIKLIFDKNVYNCSWNEIVNNEIFRQRDKSQNNNIGYFHQRIFQYIKNCTVPQTGWDVILSPKGGVNVPDCGIVKTVYVEMKNKHNTMNSASAGKTYIKMQNQLLHDDDCACFLVEAIAKSSQNIKWVVTVDKEQHSHKAIRRVSMDEFYSIVTGDCTAFYKMCNVLPLVIEDICKNSKSITIPKDTVFAELEAMSKKYNNYFPMALYMLGFSLYNGFEK